MKNLIIIAILIVIAVIASVYIYKSKKNGKGCIGCPYAESCGKDFEKCTNKTK